MADTKHDGGPAFPGGESYYTTDLSGCRYECSKDPLHKGMSLRDYLAAHAPSRPAEWFRVVMPRPRPAAEEGRTEDCDDPTSDVGCRVVINRADIRAWDLERARQVTAQWPWAYADAVLAAREAFRSTVQPQETHGEIAMGEVKEAVKGKGLAEKGILSKSKVTGDNVIEHIDGLREVVSELTTKKDDDAMNEGEDAKAENVRKAGLLRATHSLLTAAKTLMELY